MTTVAEFQAAIDAARAHLEAEWQGVVASAYNKALRAIGREAADRFATVTQGGAVTAATNPQWTPPSAAEVAATSATAAAAETLAKHRRRALKAVEAVLEDRIGISFEIGGVYATELLDGMGRRAGVELDAAAAETINGTIAQSFDDGLSVDQTARAIREQVYGVSEARARMLARTDMIGLANGGAMLAAKAVYPDGGLDKQWKTADDERVRDTHVAAEGQRVPLEQPFTVGEAQLQYPGDPDGPDGEIINCRCVALFVETGSALTAAAVDFADGTMIAVYPTLEQAQALAVPGGQPVDDLHVTLAFLPDGLADDQHDALVETLGLELPAGILDGQVGGMGRFQPGDEGVPQIALPSVDGLAEVRQVVVERLDDLGITYARNWGWCPHITLAYTEDDATVPDRRGAALTFSEVAVKRGTETTLIPLEPGGTDMTQTAEAATTELAPGAPWKAVLCVEGVHTEDGRLLELGSIGWRELPLSLGVMFDTPHADVVTSAPVCGRMDLIRREGAKIVAGGVFDKGELGYQVQGMVDDQTLRGISVDLAVLDYEYRDAETGKVLDDDEIMDALFDGREVVFVVLDGKIGAATVCAFQAIEDATIALAASAHRPLSLRLVGTFTGHEALTASGAGVAPELPPAEWFDDPGLDEPTPLTITDDGRIFGHLAEWDRCHTGIADSCVLARPSRSGYAYFHTGEIVLENGDRVSCGRLTLDGPHASTEQGVTRRQVLAHYDNTGTVAGYVRAGDDRHGVWLAGTIDPDLSPAALRRLRGNPPSGDWRGVDGHLELLAALTVPVAGFPIPRAQARVSVTASGMEQVEVLIATSTAWDYDDCGCDDCDELSVEVVERRIRVLAARAEGGLDGLAELATAGRAER